MSHPWSCTVSLQFPQFLISCFSIILLSFTSSRSKIFSLRCSVRSPITRTVFFKFFHRSLKVPPGSVRVLLLPFRFDLDSPGFFRRANDIVRLAFEATWNKPVCPFAANLAHSQPNLIFRFYQEQQIPWISTFLRLPTIFHLSLGLLYHMITYPLWFFISHSSKSKFYTEPTLAHFSFTPPNSGPPYYIYNKVMKTDFEYRYLFYRKISPKLVFNFDLLHRCHPLKFSHV